MRFQAFISRGNGSKLWDETRIQAEHATASRAALKSCGLTLTPHGTRLVVGTPTCSKIIHRKKSTVGRNVRTRCSPSLTSSKPLAAARNTRIRVLCVDHHPIILAGIAATLKLDLRLEIVGLIEGVTEALLQFERLRPDIVLTELGMPGFPGVDTVHAFMRIHSAARVIVLTGEGEGWSIRQALAAGAVGFLLKSRSIEEIGDSIEAAFLGRHVLDPMIAHDVAAQLQDRDLLNAPEIEALRLLATGTRTVDVARSLHIDLGEARAIISSAIRKLGVANRTQAVMLAKANGLLGDG